MNKHHTASCGIIDGLLLNKRVRHDRDWIGTAVGVCANCEKHRVFDSWTFQDLDTGELFWVYSCQACGHEQKKTLTKVTP